jgi:amino acid transporter
MIAEMVPPMSMTAVRALINAETVAIRRSWLVRIWVAFALVTSVLPVLFVTDDEETVSEVIGGWLSIYFIASAIVAAILGAGSIAQDGEVAADTVLTRAVTRWDYVSAKLLSRLGSVAVVHIAATLPLLFFARRFGLDDATSTGLVMATLATGIMLIFVTTLGVATGTILRNMIAAVVLIMVVFALQGFLFDFLNLEFLSSSAVLSDLPAMIRGDMGEWEQSRIVLAFGAGSLALAVAACVVFDKREF